MKKPLKVGFDLDGVLLYNPARLIRPLIKLTKQKILKKKKTKFFIPETPIQRFMWDVLHKSSLFPAPGIKEIYRLVDSELIEAYIITARFEHLKNDTLKWFDRLNKKGHFTRTIYNKNALQPHHYKQQIISDLDLDFFVEDNWDIVKHISQAEPGRSVLWVTNLLDARIPYKHKHFSLKSAIKTIESAL